MLMSSAKARNKEASNAGDWWHHLAAVDPVWISSTRISTARAKREAPHPRASDNATTPIRTVKFTYTAPAAAYLVSLSLCNDQYQIAFG